MLPLWLSPATGVMPAGMLLRLAGLGMVVALTFRFRGTATAVGGGPGLLLNVLTIS